MMKESQNPSAWGEWHYRFMEVAKVISSWSKDPSSKVSAVAVNRKKQLYLEGFNGFPSRIKDSKERLSNREIKYSMILHAEQNLISNATANRCSLEDAIVYVYGIPPCHKCALELIQADISHIVVNRSDINNSRDSWKESWKLAKEFFNEAGVEIIFL